MFVTRLISGIVLVITVGAALFIGGDLLFGLVLLISLIGLHELYKVMKLEKQLPAIVGYLGTIGYFIMIKMSKEELFIYFILVLLILLMTVYVFSFPKYKTEEILMAFFGVFYVSIMLSYVYKTRMMENGLIIIWLLFISSWVSDTCAYCVGMLTAKTVGNHKLAPRLSPKKSVEGAVGGFTGSFLIGMLYGSIAGDSLTNMVQPVLACGIICGAGSVIAVIGDLAASAVKRNYGIKDYGKLIPGHGGILDRFDSVIFTAPVIYFLAAVVIPEL